MSSCKMKVIAFIAAFLTVFSATACFGGSENSAGGSTGDSYESGESESLSASENRFESDSESGSGDTGDMEEKLDFKNILAKQSFSLNAGEKKTINVARNIGAANYLKLTVESEVNLEGYFDYANTETDERKREEFFIEKNSETPFYQLIDWYSRVGEPTRDNEESYYKIPETWYERKEYDKRIDSISFTNKGDKAAEIKVVSLEVAEREMVLSKTVYLENDYIKAGINLGWGGGIGFLTRMDKNVQQVVIGNENAIGVNYAKKEGAKLVADRVNLINQSTAGRSAQVSLYGKNVDDETYSRGIYRTTKKEWPYNPVQCGDQWDTHSEVVDYKIGKDEIYVKTRPRDWASCVSTKSYIECRYSISGKVVKAENRYFDWTGLTHDKYDENGELVSNKRNQEVPALSAVVPLNTMVLYEGDDPWTGKNLTYLKDLGYWSVASGQAGKYLSTTKARESWAAWVNADDFGLGLYVPDIEKAVAGRHLNYNLSFTGLADAQIQFNYLTFLGVFALETYEPLSYEFYLTADNVTQMRRTFKALNDSGECKNDDIKKWQMK